MGVIVAKVGSSRRHPQPKQLPANAADCNSKRVPEDGSKTPQGCPSKF
jgi:hypothetical protein